VLQTLSQQLHSLASAELYRNLDFNLADETNESSGIASRAAEALQTILASEHDYARYVKSFRLGFTDDKPSSRPTMSTFDSYQMTQLLWDSKKEPSKFLNTAILLMARKASILETFK